MMYSQCKNYIVLYGLHSSHHHTAQVVARDSSSIGRRLLVNLDDDLLSRNGKINLYCDLCACVHVVISIFFVFCITYSYQLSDLHATPWSMCAQCIFNTHSSSPR